ncbi:MAG: peroxiredoxin [Bacteroidales bacterium]|jgi:thioredoxin-dependent peroxiredoxin|nr:peroxiredoxin [Bacteroidales bacterium]MDG2080725.1 peroxiredoxin [Bacteroidales bacterium]
MDIITNNIWLILFIAWGLPLSIYRSRFRKIVYQTDSWTINIKPVFIREVRGLFGNLYPHNKSYIKERNFYRFYLLAYAILFVLYIILHNDNKIENMNKIEIGSKIPSFELKDQHNKLFKIDSVIGEKNLVIYFYPKDDTPGCTKEACSFRDQYADFEDADAIIIGISGQSVKSHLAFANKYNLNYTLLADENNMVRKLFKVPSNLLGLIPGRVTYLVNKEGIVVYKFNSQSDAEKHVSESLEFLKGLK